jgi:hypothetical protein
MTGAQAWVILEHIRRRPLAGEFVTSQHAARLGSYPVSSCKELSCNFIKENC